MANSATVVKSAVQPLGVSCFAITNFRTFRGRTAFELQEDVTVFHGDTGSGKSTALAALDVFFRALAYLLTTPIGQPQVIPWGAPVGGLFGRTEPLLSERDRPIAAAPTVLAATFADDPMPWVEIHFTPAGPNVLAELKGLRVSEPAARQHFLARLFPFGSTSRPFALLDARRRPRWVSPRASGSLLAPSLALELYALCTSKLAGDRQRWRSFAAMLERFPTLCGATISIEAGDPPELVIEHAGRIVLGLDELSSGEQELAALTAGLLLARAGIVAIEEPEMGLDIGTQELWRDMCEEQRRAGFVHQFIFESHAVTFDGARVMRFRRDAEGSTQVERAIASAGSDVTREAKEKGASEVFVSREGFTRLPDAMRKEVAVGENGARVWFLRGAERWEAWPEAELDNLFAEKGK